MSACALQSILLLLVPLTLLCPTPARCQQCTDSDGAHYPVGHSLLHPDDDCKSRVCRCASEDRCGFIVETRTVRIRVNETRTSGAETQIVTQTMHCTCTDHMPGSVEMDFTCTSPTQPGREIGAKIIGCLDSDGRLVLPGNRVHILNSRREGLNCDCNNVGHYVNCLPENDPGDTCWDTVSQKKVALAETYYRIERNSQGIPLRLRCTCVRADQETSCTVV